VCIYRPAGPNENYAKKNIAGSRDMRLNFWITLVYQERLQLESSARAIGAMHSMQPLPSYFGLLAIYIGLESAELAYVRHCSRASL